MHLLRIALRRDRFHLPRSPPLYPPPASHPRSADSTHHGLSQWRQHIVLIRSVTVSEITWREKKHQPLCPSHPRNSTKGQQWCKLRTKEKKVLTRRIEIASSICSGKHASVAIWEIVTRSGIAADSQRVLHHMSVPPKPAERGSMRTTHTVWVK